MINPEEIRASKAQGRKISALTAYDYPMGRLLDESGLDLILVGDSVGMVVLGHPDTTLVTMDDMIHHTRAVARGVSRALLVADLPALSYRTPTEAVANGRRLLDAGARAVKLEGGISHRAQLEALTAAGIATVGHIGMLPQSVREEGGYKVKGRTEPEALALLADARAVESAGRLRGGAGNRRAEDGPAHHRGISHFDNRHRFGTGLRWTDSCHPRFDRLVSVVSA